MWVSPKSSILLVAVLVIHAVLLISPLVYLLGFRASLIIPATTALVVGISAYHGRRIPFWAVLLLLASLVTACLAGIYWESWRAALLPAYFGISLLAVTIASTRELRLFISISSVILLLMLIGGWIAVFMAFSGFSSLDEVSGLHSRRLYFFYTTLTPTLIGNFIRPAGIYDEPGALSLVICVIAFLRHVMEMDRRYTWLLLMLGFVTFSVAHLIYAMIHFLSERKVLAAWTNLLVFTCVAYWALSAIGIWELFDERLISRLAVSEDPQALIEGDNRTRSYLRAATALSEGGSELLLFGVDVSCIEGTLVCRRDHSGFDFNPLAPLVYYGFLISWSYYLFLGITLGTGILRRNWWPFMAVGLLYMQRPNFFSAGYALLAAASLIVFFRYAYLPKSEGSRGSLLESNRILRV